jgi:hypothetical protein
MNVLKTARLITVILMAFMLASCSTGKINKKTASVTKLSQFGKVKVAVTSAKKDPVYGKYAGELKAATLAKISAKKLFAGKNAAGDLTIQLKLTEIVDEGLASHIFFGPLTPDSKAVVEVSVIDAKTNRALGGFEAEGISRSDTSAAIDKAAEQIVAYLEENL